MKIPYGLSDFAGLRRGGMFYADKTPFLRELESAEAGYRFLIFLRPRRIGKSLLVSMLEHYYDQAFGERFDDLFRGLWVHEHPTPERGSYLALSLDFSPVTTSGDAEAMRRSFTTTVKGGVRTFLMRYRSRFPDLAQLLASLDSHDDAAGLMTTLLSIVAGMGQQMYLIIDEYDHFANRLPASGQEGLYELLVPRPALLEDPRLGDRAELLATLESYYDGYRFSTRAAESVFNSDLILYFLSEVESTGRYPEQMLDINARTDYGRLQRIASLSGGAGSAIRGLLETILTEEHVSSDLVEQFGMRAMYGRAQLVSLFYYMGMLTFGPGAADKAQPEMVIPNRVIRTLQWECMAYVLQDQQRLVLDMSDVEDALVAMAARGDVTPLVELFRDKVRARIGVKDQRQFNEGTLKLMLLAYLSNSHIFHILSEKEFARGYCDLFLTPAQDLATLRYAWMLEVKYLKTGAKTADIEKAVQAAYAQLERYSSDAALVALLTRGRELRAGALIFAGAKDVLFYPWPPVPEKAAAPARKAAKGPRKRVSGRGRV